ncbi:MAG: hypothetical protein FK733_14715 [Asgard group archaeon]|nr:hypothetical protein [Asgard group archaeon]
MVLKKKDKKKKHIPTKDILKVIKDVEYLDLGEPFGESARRFMAYKLSKMIDEEEITGTVITPVGVYISLTSKEVKDVFRLISAKGISDLDQLAEENNWNKEVVKLIAKNRINLLYRKDKKVITRKTALDLVIQKVNQGIEVEFEEIAEELQLKVSQVKDLLKSLIEDKKVDGYFLKSSEKFLPKELLEESIKEMIEDFEMQKVTEVSFHNIANEYDISDDEVYNILLKLYNAGDIDVQLNLAQKICMIKENIDEDDWDEKIPEEEKKLDIEDLTQKK